MIRIGDFSFICVNNSREYKTDEKESFYKFCNPIG